LRAYLRQRAMLIEHRAMHIQHMQKALQQMNVQLTQVLSDITGVTGMAILRAIVAGEHDPVQLAHLRNPRCSHPEPEIAKALTGQYRPEHLFALKQALALYDTYSERMRECDEELERQFSALKPERDEELPPLDEDDKRNTHSKNAPGYDARDLLYQMLGVDLVAVNGLHSSTVETIIAEIGTDMSHWPTVKHFCSWLGLAPRHDRSGGKIVHRHKSKTTNRAGQALRLAAQAVERTQTALGAYFRSMKAKHGPAIAVVATAHKIARILYAMLTHHRPFRDMGAEEYERRERQREIARLEKRAAKLGFKLLSVSEAV
jgi:hypothetical protein